MVDPSGDPSENEASVDLKGVISDLHDEIKALNALLKTFGAGIQANTKNFHKSTADQVMLIKLQGEMVRENADYRKSLTTSQDAMKMFTGALTKGIPATAIFGAALTKIGGLSKELDNFKAAAAEFSDFQKEVGVKDQKSKEFANLSTEDQAKYMEKQENMEQKKKDKEGAFGGQGGMSGKMVDGISKMGEFGKKHMGGILIGAGSAGVLISILKKALSASPMFQQMMKLLNFGIMMVLRPIGDFFGFLFRPILIMLLRKFIIPWYTKMMPVMMKMGDLIGKKLAGAFEALAKGDVSAAFAILFADVDFGQIMTDAFAGIHKWLEETDWDQVWLDIKTGLVAFGTEIWDRLLVPLFTAISAELGKVDWWAAIWDTLKVVIPVLAVADLVAGLFGIGDNQWFNEMGQEIRKWFLKGLEEATNEWNKFFTGIQDWFIKGLTDAATNWTDFFEQIKQAILTSMGLGFLIDEEDRTNGGATDPEPQQEGWNPLGWITGANGARITEPIAGVGRSGQKYLFGEAGNETVIPDDQLGGGGNITINIENMSASQQDLNNLRQVILDVVQQSSARRGRA